MGRLFALFLFGAFFYHLIRGDHTAHQALTPEPVRRSSRDQEYFDD